MSCYKAITEWLLWSFDFFFFGNEPVRIYEQIFNGALTGTGEMLLPSFALCYWDTLLWFIVSGEYILMQNGGGYFVLQVVKISLILFQQCTVKILLQYFDGFNTE